VILSTFALEKNKKIAHQFVSLPQHFRTIGQALVGESKPSKKKKEQTKHLLLDT
jgi:hypothetical protein